MLLTAIFFFDRNYIPLSGNNSVVECDLAKVEVAGSNPVSRSKIFKGLAERLAPLLFQGAHMVHIMNGINKYAFN